MEGDYYLKAEDRNKEAALTNYEMGVADINIVPDLNSPRFQRARTQSPPTRVEETGRRRKHRRQPSPHAPVSCESRTTAPPDTPPPPSKTVLGHLMTSRHNTQTLIAVLVLCLSLLAILLVRAYGQELDRLLGCPTSRYQAAAFKERGCKYYMCRYVKAIRKAAISSIWQ